MRRLAAILIILLFAVPALAGHKHLEKEYQAKWCDCQGGTMEVYLIDGRRVDCVTDKWAIEFDFGFKLFESLGQALHYADMTGKGPGIVLILETERDWEALDDLIPLALKHRVSVWTMTPEDLEK